MASAPSRRSYKEVRLQQLRSFCETARLGSLAAAAAALGLAQPTVWEQVHALEREFGAKLVEPHGRGCLLTEAGRVLAGLAAPLVAGVDALKEQFQSARHHIDTWLTLATTQRVFVEDLPHVIAAFQRRWPHVHLRFLELTGDRIAAAVEARQADLGLSVERATSASNPWLEFDPAYHLEPILIVPKDHPLAKRRRVRPEDLRGYPLVSRKGFADRSVETILEKLGVLDGPPCRVEANYTTVIRRYVEMGFGIGIVPGLPGRESSPRLHERSMARDFGTVAINLIWRKGSLGQEHVRNFAATLKAVLKLNPKRHRA